MANCPIWLPGEDVVFYDDDQFAVILISNKYFPVGKFTGYLVLDGLSSLSSALSFSQSYYKES